MDEQSVIHPDWILLSNKTDLTTDPHNSADESQIHYVKLKKSASKDHILRDSINMTFCNKVKVWGKKTDQCLPGTGSEVGGTTKWHKGMFVGNRTVLYLNCGVCLTTVFICQNL